MAKDADNSKDHAREIAVGIANEDARRVPIVGKEGARYSDPWEKEVQGEEVRVGCWMGIGGKEVEAIVEGEQQCNDNALGNLDPVDACQHVDTLGAEHGDASHVNVVEHAKVEEFAQVGLQLKGDDDRSNIEINEVDNEKRDGCETGDPPLVPPTDIEEIVADA